MKTFTEKELRLVHRVRKLDPLAILELRETCPRHSACMPLPLFVVRKASDEEFEAAWNDFHSRGPRQRFRFADVAPTEVGTGQSSQPPN